MEWRLLKQCCIVKKGEKPFPHGKMTLEQQKHTLTTMRQAAEILKRKLVQRAGAPFAGILNEQVIEATLTAAQVKYRKRLLTPLVTIWAFLYQVLDADKSLANAVKQIHCWLAVEGATEP